MSPVGVGFLEVYYIKYILRTFEYKISGARNFTDLYFDNKILILIHVGVILFSKLTRIFAFDIQEHPLSFGISKGNFLPIPGVSLNSFFAVIQACTKRNNGILISLKSHKVMKCRC